MLKLENNSLIVDHTISGLNDFLSIYALSNINYALMSDNESDCDIAFIHDSSNIDSLILKAESLYDIIFIKTKWCIKDKIKVKSKIPIIWVVDHRLHFIFSLSYASLYELTTGPEVSDILKDKYKIPNNGYQLINSSSGEYFDISHFFVKKYRENKIDSILNI